MIAERFRRRLDRVLDPLLALLLLGVGLVDIWVFAPSDFFTIAGPRPANTAFLLAVCLPLAWRRRAPLATSAVVVSATIAWVYAFGDLTVQPPFEAFIALLFMAYTVAAYTEGRRTAAGAGILLLVVLADIPALVSGREPGDTIPAWLFGAFAFVVGRVVHQQRALTSALNERASELEREREEKARLAVALERARIARELHDVVTHNVSLMVIQASVERRMIEERHDSTSMVLGSIEEIGRKTLGELRRLVGVLRKDDERPPLAPQPRLAALSDLVERTQKAGLPVELLIEGEAEQLSEGMELAVYRVVQEALTNSLNHAEARHAHVLIRYADGRVELEVTDDGRGSTEETSSGHGLVGMRERVELYGGTLETGVGAEGRGYRVYARLPIDNSTL